MTIKAQLPAVTVVHPATGELLEHLDAHPSERLAETLDAIRDYQRMLKDEARLLEDELRRRMELQGRKLSIFGDWEVSVEGGREAVWDADEVEVQLREMVDQGVLAASELTGVIKHETTVNRTEINKVLGRLSGSARKSLEGLRTWKSKGQPQVRVTRSVELLSAETLRGEITDK